MAIGIPKKAPDLSAPIERLCEKLGAAAPECIVCGSAIWHPDGQLVADHIRLLGGSKGDIWFVLCWPTTCDQQKPIAHKAQNTRCFTVFPKDGGTEYITIEIASLFHVTHDEEMSELNTSRKFHMIHR